ncbi:MAG: zinc-binding dehydrogenase [Chloroflexi bacterium]|nr:zinc-binding dehydrogenase [Chloroflexota bacterium]
MKAAVYQGKHRFEVRDLPTPEPGPGQVLMKTTYSGICGTDVHGILYDLVAPGSVLGHEYAGVVAGVGKGVTKWKEGDRIAGAQGGQPPEGMVRGFFTPRYNFRTMGWGEIPPAFSGYAEYILMDEWQPAAVPLGVSDVQACMVEPMAAAMHSVRRSKIKPGDTVAVFGAGPLGLFAMQVAKAWGASKVIVSEPAPARAKAAKAVGADVVLDPTKVDVVEEMVKLTEGHGPHIVIEAAGAKPTLQQAMETVRREGRVVLLAIPWEQVPVLPADWCTRDAELTTTFAFDPEEFPECFDLLERGKVTVEPLLSSNSLISLEQLGETFQKLFKPSEEIKMVVKF